MNNALSWGVWAPEAPPTVPSAITRQHADEIQFSPTDGDPLQLFKSIGTAHELQSNERSHNLGNDSKGLAEFEFQMSSYLSGLITFSGKKEEKSCWQRNGMYSNMYSSKYPCFWHPGSAGSVNFYNLIWSIWSGIDLTQTKVFVFHENLKLLKIMHYTFLYITSLSKFWFTWRFYTNVSWNSVSMNDCILFLHDHFSSWTINSSEPTNYSIHPSSKLGCLTQSHRGLKPIPEATHTKQGINTPGWDANPWQATHTIHTYGTPI